MADKPNVKIYIETSIKNPRGGAGAYGYIIVFCTTKKTDTGEIKPIKADTGEIKLVKDVTRNQAVLTALNEALKRLTKPCYLTIYTDVDHIAAAIKNHWLSGWEKAGWKNAKGEEIVNKDLWLSIQSLLYAHDFLVALKHHHEYKDWLIKEVARKANEEHI